ncbi:MAG: substrate-binding domain-containing protein [Treponema sp.]|jgi:phosphate transport system substrate-binding protein|nr:substrate-binding domain-containing protein [Treponema sp.]
MEIKTKKALKLLINILIGLAVSIISFYAFIILLFLTDRNILLPLLCVFFVSIMVFLILWNKKSSKFVYLLLSIPVMCIMAGIIIINNQHRVNLIPTVREQFYPLFYYEPFSINHSNNLLAQLDEEPLFKTTGSSPVLDGATALYPLYASFVQAVYPDGNYDVYRSPVFCSKTAGAYKRLFEGKVDIIFCAQPSEAQLKHFIDNNKNLKLVPIGREAFVFFVNKINPVNNLTIEDIQGIYSGKIKNWKKLNGANQGIRAFQRPQNSGSQTILEKIMGDIPLSKPRRENVSYGMADIINEVAAYRNFSNAIGYSFLYFSTEMVKNDQIKLLSVNGIYPSKETIQDESYPLYENFYAIYIDTDEKNENIEPFIYWILSEQGQELVQRTGYIPLP